MRYCIVVQSKNSFDYLSLFLAHHERLVDRIVVIDHNSDRDLRDLHSSKIEVHRLDVAAYLQVHSLNFFLHSVLQVTRQSGMLFVLDVDEFLPFGSRTELDAVMAAHRDDAVVSFQWRNGYAEGPNQLVDPSGIRFCRERTPTLKLAYNLDRLGLFFPLGGNHKVKFPRAFWRWKAPTVGVVDTGLGLLHLPFVGVDGLRQKVRENPSHEFEHKISENYRLIGLDEDKPWGLDAVPDELLLQLIANYRTNVPEGRLRGAPEDFEPVPFMAGLTDRVKTWKTRIEGCRAVQALRDDGEAIAALKAVRPGCFGYVRKLSRHLRLAEGRRVVLARRPHAFSFLGRLMTSSGRLLSRDWAGN